MKTTVFFSVVKYVVCGGVPTFGLYFFDSNGASVSNDDIRGWLTIRESSPSLAISAMRRTSDRPNHSRYSLSPHEAMAVTSTINTETLDVDVNAMRIASRNAYLHANTDTIRKLTFHGVMVAGARQASRHPGERATKAANYVADRACR